MSTQKMQTASKRLHQKPTASLSNEANYSYDSTLYQICQEENINFQFLSRNWVKRLERNGQVHFIVGFKFDLNSAAASLVADDKYALFETLEFARVPVIDHAILYEPTNTASHALGCNSMPYILNYFEKHQRDIVIKGNNSTGGRQVYHVTSPDQIPPVLIEVFHQNYSASLCPFYHIRHEYRVILLDGAVRLAYRKSLSGAQSNWKFNLQQGAWSEPILEQQYPELIALAKRAVAAIGLRFCSVDIIETDDGQLLVIEINSGVMIQRYVEQHPDAALLVREIYHDAIRKMFEKPSSDKNVPML